VPRSSTSPELGLRSKTMGGGTRRSGSSISARTSPEGVVQGTQERLGNDARWPVRAVVSGRARRSDELLHGALEASGVEEIKRLTGDDTGSDLAHPLDATGGRVEQWTQPSQVLEEI
jgi:hypothetical protein